jgi:hypothetical protein
LIARNRKLAGFAFFIYVSIGFFILLSGCVNESTNSSTVPPVATGYVYFDGNVISGATVEALSADGTDHQSNITDDRGAYVLNITPMKIYNITAKYQVLRHTIWPVYLDNKTDTYNISLTTTPRSTIEGTAYAFHEGEPFPVDHILDSPVIDLVPTAKNHTTLSTYIGRDGSYSMEVDPNVQYRMSGYIGPGFYYHNSQARVRDHLITIGPNETALIDVEFYLP